MKFLVDFFPILIFFIIFKFFGIYYATAGAMAVSLLQVIFFRIKYQTYEKMHLISLAMIFILGSATLLLHDPMFIKWKPTAIYWLTAFVFLGSRFIGNKTLIQKIMENNISLPVNIWHLLNYAWMIFFTIMGGLNLYVANHFDTNTWVNFKLFGGTGLTLIFVFLQAIYLSRHLIAKEESRGDSQKGLL